MFKKISKLINLLAIVSIFVSPIAVEANTYIDDMYENQQVLVNSSEEIEYIEAEDNVDDVDNIAKVEILSFVYSSEPNNISIELGEELLNLNEYIFGITEDNDFIKFKVLWKLEDFNFNVVGETEVIGDVILTEEYFYSAGEPIITVPITIRNTAQQSEDIESDIPNSDDIIGVVTSVIPIGPEIYMLEYGGNILDLNICDKAIAIYNDNEEIECSVEWDFENFYDEGGGIRNLYGKAILPDGFVLEYEEYRVIAHIYIYNSPDGGDLRIEKIIFEDAKSALIPQGLSDAELESYIVDFLNYKGKATLITQFGIPLYIDFTIDFSVIDTQKVGGYLPFDVDLPEGMVMFMYPEDSPYLYVVPSDEVYLGAFSPPTYTYRDLHWMYTPSNPRIMCAINDGEWEVYDPAIHSNLFELNNTQMRIFYTKMKMGNKYYVCIEYDGDKVSNILEIDLTSGYPDYGEGDRPGLDRGEQELPSDDTSGNVNDGYEDDYVNDYWEWEDEISFNDTGEMILEKIQSSDEYVTYIKDGLFISIPIEYLRTLLIEKTDDFSLILKKDDSDKIHTSIEVNDEKVENTSEPTLMIGHTNPNKKVVMKDKNSASVENKKVENKDIIPIKNEETYEFAIEEKPSPESEPQTESDDIIANATIEGSANEKIVEDTKSNSVLPIVIMCSIGIIGTLAYFIISKRR